MNDIEATAERIMPSLLVTRCMLLVEQTHKAISSQPLPRMIATKRNAVAIAFFPEGRTAKGSERNGT